MGSTSWKQDKAEAASKAVEDLIVGGFVNEIIYTIWLLKVILVKKSDGKCGCV